MIAPFRWIRNHYRSVKWWFMRANGKVPPCDWWEFKYSLASYIEQGIEGLLYEGVCDWDSPTRKKEKEALEFILKWAKTYPYMASAVIARNKTECAEMTTHFQGTDTMIITMDAWKEWEKEQAKAFKLLAKYYETLWD